MRDERRERAWPFRTHDFVASKYDKMSAERSRRRPRARSARPRKTSHSQKIRESPPPPPPLSRARRAPAGEALPRIDRFASPAMEADFYPFAAAGTLPEHAEQAGAYHAPVTAVAFDALEELAYAGTEDGRLTALHAPTLERYAAVQAHPSGHPVLSATPVANGYGGVFTVSARARAITPPDASSDGARTRASSTPTTRTRAARWTRTRWAAPVARTPAASVRA